MKILKLSTFFILVFGLFAAFRPVTETSEGIEWLDIQTAMKKAKAENKPVFVDVYTDWCGWCKRMDKATFSDQKVIDYVNENYIAVKLDAESKSEVFFKGETLSNGALALQKFGVRGYPTIVLLSPDGERIQPVPGFKRPNEFIAMLKGFSGQ